MMRVFFAIAVFLCLATRLSAHILHYDLAQGAWYVRVFFGGGEPATHAPFEIYAPGASLPFATGQTDARGVLAFLPDSDGLWHISVSAGSDHGEHLVEFDVDIKGTSAKLESTPLYNQYGAMITGISIIFGIFGLVFGLSKRARAA